MENIVAIVLYFFEIEDPHIYKEVVNQTLLQKLEREKVGEAL